MGWSQTDQVCHFHPYFNLKLGVCPSCLREKLSALTSSSSTHNNTKAVVFASSYFTSLSSSPSSPSINLPPASGRRRHHQRHGSEVLGTVSFGTGLVGRTVDALRKSHSIAFVSSNPVDGEMKTGKKSKKGFWSKLLHWKGKKEVLMHQGNVNEIKGTLKVGF